MTVKAAEIDPFIKLRCLFLPADHSAALPFFANGRHPHPIKFVALFSKSNSSN